MNIHYFHDTFYAQFELYTYCGHRRRREREAHVGRSRSNAATAVFVGNSNVACTDGVGGTVGLAIFGRGDPCTPLRAGRRAFGRTPLRMFHAFGARSL